VFVLIPFLTVLAIKAKIGQPEPSDRGLFEERELAWLGRPRDAPVGPEIDAADEERIALCKQLLGLGADARKARLLPDLVEATRVTAVAGNEVAAADAEPARDPDVDGVGLGQRASLRRGRGGDVQRKGLYD
jgi:hypothetical protein